MLDLNSHKPLYEQIKEYILHNIQVGAYPPHSRLPSERDLAKQFGVSRLTVNKAIKELITAGWLHTQVGKGTFIKDEPIDFELEMLTSFTEEISRRGQSVSSRVIEARIMPSDLRTARQLKIPTGVAILRLKRIRMANKRPIALENSAVIASVCPGILDRHNFARDSLYQVLRYEYDVMLTYAEQIFEARAAAEDEAEYLGIRPDDPLLAISRITYTQKDSPVEYVESVYRGDRYKFRAVLRNI